MSHVSDHPEQLRDHSYGICEKYVFDVCEDDCDSLFIQHRYHTTIESLQKLLEISNNVKVQGTS